MIVLGTLTVYKVCPPCYMAFIKMQCDGRFKLKTLY